MSSAQENLFEKTCIIGPGLIGSSLALAMREKDLCQDFTGYARSKSTRDEAVALGIVGTAPDSLKEAVAGCDLIVLAVPVGAIAALVPALNAYVQAGAVLMDVGSVKGSVIDAVSDLRDDLHFVAAHPIAGTEKSGPSAGFSTLFQNRWSIITPTNETNTDALKKVEALWKGVGSDVSTMPADHHDLALAVTSHLPHLIAFTLVGAADDMEGMKQREIIKYAAGGFRDFTRIASSDPVMWRDVFLNNKDAVLEVLGRFSEELAVMQQAISSADGEALEKAFIRSRSIRQQIIEAGQDSAETNFGRDS